MSDHVPASPAAPLADADQLARLRALVQMQQGILNTIPTQMIAYEIISRTEIRLILANRAVLEMSGFSEAELVGKRVTEFFPPDEAAEALRTVQACVDANAVIETLDHVTLPHGRRWLQCACMPLRDDLGQITRVLITTQDITEQKEREEDVRRQQAEIIDQQQATLAELSTPLLTISDTTVVMPLVGAIDSRRIQQIMETLLTGVVASRAATVILDITGVSVVDTQVADALIRASQAVNLLGAQVVLTGIRPEVAQTLIGLGVELRGVITRSTLRDGIAYALKTSRGEGVKG